MKKIFRIDIFKISKYLKSEIVNVLLFSNNLIDLLSQ